MYRRSIILGALLALACTPKVPRSQMNMIPAGGLSEIEAAEAEVSRVDQELAETKVAVKEAKRARRVRALDAKAARKGLKADQAEVQAAKAGDDESDTQSASENVATGHTSLDTAQQVAREARLQYDLLRAREDLLEAELELREAELELREAEGVRAGGGEISISRFEKAVAKARIDYEKARADQADAERALLKHQE